MIVENINKLTLRPRVLLAPLDWGLGHATRCIPIINVLIEHNIEVVLAAEGNIGKLLKEEFPSIVILPLPGYKVKYSRRKWSFSIKMLSQIPRLILSIKNERQWLEKIRVSHKIDAVISDNRFGLSNSKISSVYITHQLFIETGNSLLNKITQKINYRFINKFDECWIPDVDAKDNLAGKLSRPDNLPKIPVKYIGILSRMKKIIKEKKHTLLIILSGPEPQRTIFEVILLDQLDHYKGSAILVRGLPAAEKKLSIENKKIIIYDHLQAEKLNTLIQQSVNIIARSGYSTIMDLVTVEQKAILVPTPGQTEQQYLAHYLMENKLFFTCSQESFVLEEALKENKTFDFNASFKTGGIQKDIIIDWIKTLQKKFMS